jgi:hypothetical protein
VVEGVRLAFPFVAELRGNTLDEGGELVELLFGIGAAEEVEVGVVVNLPFLGPQVVISGLRAVAVGRSRTVVSSLHCDA